MNNNKRPIFAFIALMAMALFSEGCDTVEPGNVGVVVRFGSVDNTPQGPGMYPNLFSTFHMMSTRTQTYTMAGPGGEARVDGSVNVLARDQLPVQLDVSVMYHLDGQSAVQVYKAFGEAYDESIVHPLVRTAVRDAASTFTAVDLIDKRAELQALMTQMVRQTLASTLQGRSVNSHAVTVDNLLVRNIDLPQALDEAIANVQRQHQLTMASTEANRTAQQEAARALTIAQGEAAALVARTNADAEMLRIRSTSQAAANRALSASLTPEFLRYEQIQATRAVLSSNGTRTVFLPAGMSPNMLMPVNP